MYIFVRLSSDEIEVHIFLWYKCALCEQIVYYTIQLSFLMEERLLAGIVQILEGLTHARICCPFSSRKYITYSQYIH